MSDPVRLSRVSGGETTVVTLIPLGDLEYTETVAVGGCVTDQEVLTFGSEGARDAAMAEHASILAGRGYSIGVPQT